MIQCILNILDHVCSLSGSYIEPSWQTICVLCMQNQNSSRKLIYCQSLTYDSEQRTTNIISWNFNQYWLITCFYWMIFQIGKKKIVKKMRVWLASNNIMTMTMFCLADRKWYIVIYTHTNSDLNEAFSGPCHHVFNFSHHTVGDIWFYFYWLVLDSSPKFPVHKFQLRK